MTRRVPPVPESIPDEMPLVDVLALAMRHARGRDVLVCGSNGSRCAWGETFSRLGVPDDIRGLAVLLASDASAWITGALIPMDGGNLAMNAGGTLRPPAPGPVA